MKRFGIDLTEVLLRLNEGHETRPQRHIEALQKLSSIFKMNLKEASRAYEKKHFSSSEPTSKEAVPTAPRVHGRVTCNNTPGIIPTSEGEGKKRRAEDSD